MSVAHHNGSAPPDLVPGASARSQPVTTAAGTEAGIQVSEVSKIFGRGASALLALDRLSLEVAPGEFVCLIGASGCGKSTLLNLVAGLDAPTAGKIATEGQRVALMFQEPALFPWLTAARNVELALRASGRAQGRAAAPGRRTAGRRAPGQLRRQAPARAVRRHAAAGRAGPGARPGRGRPAHGRAVRRARRDDPRPAPRRARADLRRARAHGPVRHAQRARGGPPRRPGGGAQQPPRTGHRRVHGADPRARAGSTRRRSPGWPPRSPTGCGRSASAMAADTGATGVATAADPRPQPWPGSTGWKSRRRRNRRETAAEDLGVRPGPSCWRSRSSSPPGSSSHLSGWKPVHPARARPRSSPTCGSSCSTPQLWQAIGTTLRRARHRLRARPGHRRGDRRAGVPDQAAAGGGRIDDHRRCRRCRRSPGSRSRSSCSAPTTSAILFVIVLGAAPSIANGLITGVDYIPPLLLRAGTTWGCAGSRCTGT